VAAEAEGAAAAGTGVVTGGWGGGSPLERETRERALLYSRNSE
jgi:hypothetical protein